MFQQGGCPAIQPSPSSCSPGLLSGLIFIAWGEECPRKIRALLKFSEASTEEDADDVEVYLSFSNNILSLFEDVVKKLENDSTTCVELYSIMSTVKQKLT